MNLRPTMGRKPADPAAAGDLVASVLGARVHVDVVVPRTAVRGRMRVLTRIESQQVRAEARQKCIALGVRDDAMLEMARDFLEDVATRTIAIAVRQSGDEAFAMAPLEDWGQCDDEQIAELWQTYKDLEESLDPVGGACSAAEAAQIADAAKKKDESLLRPFGSRKLAAYLATSADPPAS